MSQIVPDDELQPTQTAGYAPGAKKSLAEYAQLDAEDESLARWKASLGILPGAQGEAAGGTGEKLTLHSLSLISPTAPNGAVVLPMENINAEQLKKNTLTIKEGVEYHVAIKFSVGREVLSGLKYLHVVKRAGVTVDKLEEMIGSYGPRAEAYVKHFASEEAPSGMLARSGTNTVRTRIVDDDGAVYADLTWSFKIAKDW